MTKRSDAFILARNALDYAAGWLNYRIWRTRTPGVQVAVMIDGELVKNRAHGFADIESGERLGTAHQFRIASHSKWITATAFLRLAEDRALCLDDPIGRYVPEISNSSIGSVSIRELLSHSAGVTRDSADSSFWSAEKPFPTKAELIEIAAKRADVYAPSTAFKYSNIGFGLLGLALESITGSSFDDAMRELVTRPLGLNRTVPDVDDRKSSKPVTGYSGIITDHARTALANPSSNELRAATGYTSTAAELARFAHAHVLGNDELLSDHSKALMSQPLRRFRDRAGREVAYGLGTMVSSIGGRDWIGHGGSWLGQSTRTIVEPSLGIVISVLTNAIDGPAEEFAFGIAKLLLASQERRQAPLSLTGAEAIPTGSGTSAPTRTARRVDPTRFMGRFANEWSIIDVVALGDRLLAISPQSPDPIETATELTVIDENTLRLPLEDSIGPSGELLHYEFDGKDRIKRIHGAWRLTPAPSLEPFPLA